MPGRKAVDNAIICQEFVHPMRYIKAKKGAIVIKVDLEKAYDRVEWGFVEHILMDTGVPGKLLNVIMKLVSSGSCRLVWNDDAIDSIKPSRGLCQGDPLSPYLFMLCKKRLGHWLRMKVEEDKLKALKASSGPMLVIFVFLQMV